MTGNGIKLTFDEKDFREIRVDFENSEMVEAFKGLILDPLKCADSEITSVDLDANSLMINCPKEKGEETLTNIYRTVYALAFISKRVSKDSNIEEETMENLFREASDNLRGKTYSEINEMTSLL